MDEKQELNTDYVSHEQPFTVSRLVVEYTQEPDGLSSDIQILEVSAEDAGGGFYYVLKTDRWSIDNIQELIKILNDFEKRLMIPLG
jgi:hypothetical protein